MLYCVSFKCLAKLFGDTYIHMYIFFFLFFSITSYYDMNIVPYAVFKYFYVISACAFSCYHMI